MKKALLFCSCFTVSIISTAQDFSNPDYLSSTPFEIGSAAVGDFDGDGDIDGILSGYGFNTSGTEVWINNNGTFDLMSGSYPGSNSGAAKLEPADIDGDGDLDLFCAQNNTIRWYANNGNAVFSSPILIQNNVADVRQISAGELNNLPGIDIAVAFIDNDRVSIYFNNGSGGFSSQNIVSNISTDVIDVRIADFDNDGLNDLLVACLNGCDVTWHKNLGSGNFGPQQILTTSQIGTNSLDAADFDGDGDMDIVSVGYGSDDLSYFENLGSGVFGSRIIVSNTIDGPLFLVVADFTNDGNPDVVVSAQNTSVVNVFEGNGAGGFAQSTIANGFVSNAKEVLAADMNGDGLIDFVSASDGDNKFAFFPQNAPISHPSSIFGQQQFINKSAAGVNDLASVDVDNDGFMDLVSSSRSDGKIAWYRNNSYNGFEQQQVLHRFPVGVSGFVNGDLNGDGLSDFLVTNTADGTFQMLTNLGGGMVSAPILLDGGFNQPFRPAVADLDNDGDLDIILPVRIDYSIFIYYNNGNGTFAPRITLCSDCGGVDLVVAKDMNGDNFPEIFYNSAFNQQIEFYQNLGSQNFGPSQLIISNLNGAKSIVFLDYDGDGDEDVFAAGIFDPKINYAENLGNLSFSAAQEVPFVATSPWDLAVLDIDLDGDDDLAYSNFFGNKINTIIIEQGSFLSRNVVDNPYENPSRLAVGDWNGDGKTDLAAIFRNYVVTYQNLGTSCIELAPQNLTSTFNANSITLSWTPVPGTVACRVSGYVTVNPVPLSQDVFGTEPSSLTVPLSYFNTGVPYVWRVRCACELSPIVPTGNSAFVSFTVPSGLAIYPNPAIDVISLTATTSFSDVSDFVGRIYEVFDLQGRTLMEGTYGHNIDISNLANGAYILRIHGESPMKFYKE